MGTANNRTASAALDQELFDFIEDYRWSNRLNRSDIVVEAINDWAIKHGYQKIIDTETGTPSSQ